MKLYVITPEKRTDSELDIVNHLFRLGLQRLHLRKPDFTKEDYKNYLNFIDSRFYSKIVIHGFFELFTEYGLGGIHLNSGIRNEFLENKPKIQPPFISTSFHSWQEILENDFDYNYVFISPVFDSISKVGYKSGIDLKGCLLLKNHLQEIHKYCPAVIGLGGVGKDNIEILHQSGFDGAALLGAVWNSENPIKAFREMKTVAL